MGLERPTAWIILAIVALVLFGYKRLPDASRSVGRSLRIFKSEMKGMNTDDEQREAAARAKAADNGAAAKTADVPAAQPAQTAQPASAEPAAPSAEAGPAAPPRAD